MVHQNNKSKQASKHLAYQNKILLEIVFELGPATAAANTGIEDSTMHTLGRWSNLQLAFLTYPGSTNKVLKSISYNHQHYPNSAMSDTFLFCVCLL